MVENGGDVVPMVACEKQQFDSNLHSVLDATGGLERQKC